MAQVFSAAGFLMLPIAAALLLFALPKAAATDGVAHRLGIQECSSVYKVFAETSVKLDFEDGVSVQLRYPDGVDMGVTAQWFSGDGKILGTVKVREPALVIEEQSLVFVNTKPSPIRIQVTHNILWRWLYPTGNKDVNWTIDRKEAKKITQMLIGVDASNTTFGRAFAVHLEEADGKFPNTEGNWRGEGDVQLIRYDEKLYAWHSDDRQTGWGEVTSTSKLIDVEAHRSVRIDAIDANGKTFMADVTFEKDKEDWVFEAMFRGQSCSGKRTAEGLFKGTWNRTEAYAQSKNAKKGGIHIFGNRAITFRTPSATDDKTKPVSAELSTRSSNLKDDVARMALEAVGDMIYYHHNSDAWFFQLKSTNKDQSSFLVHYNAADIFSWENWSRVVVDRIIGDSESLKGFLKIQNFKKGFPVADGKIRKEFRSKSSVFALEAPIDGHEFSAECLNSPGELPLKFTVAAATWVDLGDDSWLPRKLLSNYIPYLSNQRGVLTIQGTTAENSDTVVKVTFREQKYVSWKLEV
eukprot:GHVS01001014.1.p1 GENE.GHVS01001014.1~~GHVS01001014.1.p1  ORF type:complete len:536 (+),score=49.97 GHVS01001014.1:45-1610(+)